MKIALVSVTDLGKNAAFLSRASCQMQLVSFDIFRTLGFPNTRCLKAENLSRDKAELQAADWVLFPHYWQLNALTYGLKCRVFPSPASYLIGHNKIEMTRAFQMVAPNHIPMTEILANNPENAELLWQKMDTPFVAKLPKSSMGEGVWLIEDRVQWQAYLARADVLYVQEYLPIDRDILVVVVGERVVAAYWRLRSDYTFHNNVARGGSVDYSPVPQQAIDLAQRLALDLGVDHAGFDIAMVGNHPYVFEFNRLFGNQGIPGGGETLRAAILSHLRSKLPQSPDWPGPFTHRWPEAV